VANLKRFARRLLRPLARPFLRPIFRRIEDAERRLDEVSELAVRLDRYLPLVTSSIEAQNAELRAGIRDRAEVRAELQKLAADVMSLQRQIEALRDDFLLPSGVVPQVAKASLPRKPAQKDDNIPPVRAEVTSRSDIVS